MRGSLIHGWICGVSRCCRHCADSRFYGGGAVIRFGTVSGAHCNPAVSAGMLIAGRLSVVDFMGYVVSQVFGALAAAFALYGLSKSFDAQVISQYQSYGYDLVGLGTNGYADTSAFLKINVWGAFVTELLLTFVFVLAFLCVTAKTAYKNVAGLVAGMAFCMAELFGLVLTGAGINPAKALVQPL